MTDTNERHAVTQADRDAAASYWKSHGIGDQTIYVAYRSGIKDNTSLVQAFMAHRIAAEAAQRELDAQLIEADAKLCDCSAHSEGECACGAWCESKSITSARAAEIIREQSHVD